MIELLHLATAGSVDDGKSTLIGRLLFDSKNLFDDQLTAVEKVSRRRGDERVDLSLLTDGLRAEREQGITIDVAYRYFATPRRRFIIADTPGHAQYTRNMVTGCSTADVALILIDARHGVTEQSRRHAFLASLLGVGHLMVCINKMDLVDWDESVYEGIKNEFLQFSARLEAKDIQFTPISALLGDNVVDPSRNMPWFAGTPLLTYLDSVYVAGQRDLVNVRFPVQYVIRPRTSSDRDYRGYAGSVAGGILRSGDAVRVLPSGLDTTITSIDTADGPVEEAFPPMAVTLQLADDLDVSRGDMIVRPHNEPEVTQDIDALVCWMDENAELRPRNRYLIMQTTRQTKAVVRDVLYRVDINSLHRVNDAGALALNDIGRVRLRTMQPLFADRYSTNRSTGAFILIDQSTNRTVAAGIVVE